LRIAVSEGAVQRIRPKVMTICAILFGLLPILWSPTTQSGADVMKRIAAPMIGGVVTSGILELLIYPVIFVLWRRGYLPRETRDSMTPTQVTAAPPPRETSGPGVDSMRHPYAKLLLALLLLALLGVGGYFGWHKFEKGGESGSQGRPFVTQTMNGFIVSLTAANGRLVSGRNDFVIEFRDSHGNLADVGTVRFALDMNMPGMVMHDAASVKAAGNAGQYRASIKPGMAGDWTAKLEYDGPQGKGEASFPIAVAASASNVPSAAPK